MTDKNSENGGRKKHVVFVEKELMPLIPEFIENRKKDLVSLENAIEAGDYDAIKITANNLKGSGGSYGIDAITEFGHALLTASEAKDIQGLKVLLKNYISYINHLDIQEVTAKKLCQNCGNPFASLDEESKLCPQCIIDKQERIIEETEKRQQKEKGKKLRIILYITTSILIIAAVIVIYIQLPKIFEASQSGKPLRIGTYSTDEKTDLCIKRLWEISKLMQENKKPDNTFVCPLSGKPYLFEGNRASCPNPDKHRLKALFVTREKKMPEVIR